MERQRNPRRRRHVRSAKFHCGLSDCPRETTAAGARAKISPASGWPIDCDGGGGSPIHLGASLCERAGAPLNLAGKLFSGRSDSRSRLPYTQSIRCQSRRDASAGAVELIGSVARRLCDPGRALNRRPNSRLFEGRDAVGIGMRLAATPCPRTKPKLRRFRVRSLCRTPQYFSCRSKTSEGIRDP